MARPYPNNPLGEQKTNKQTPEAIKKLEEAFAIDASIQEAAFFAGITVQTYYNWIKNNPQLLERFTELRQKPVLAARNVIVSNIRAGSAETSKWYLERKAKAEFAPKAEVALTLTEISLTDDEREEVKKMFPGL